MGKQVRARPCPGRGHGQGVAPLSPRRVAESAASLQNATLLRPPVLDSPLRPPAGVSGPAQGRFAGVAPRKLPREEAQTRGPASPTEGANWSQEPRSTRTHAFRSSVPPTPLPCPPPVPSLVRSRKSKSGLTTPLTCLVLRSPDPGKATYTNSVAPCIRPLGCGEDS